MLISKINNKQFNSLLSLSIHLRKHNLSVLNYFINYEGFILPKCAYCDSEAKHRKCLLFYKTCSSKVCLDKHFKSRVMSPESRAKISQTRTKLLSNNYQSSSWHKRNQGIMSNLEIWFDSKCLQYELYQKYDVFNEFRINKYRIDFLFKNEKVCVEMDGGYHFDKDGKRIESDMKKDSYLKNMGFTIFRIKYNEINDDAKIIELIRILETHKNTKQHDPILLKHDKQKKINKRKINNYKYDELQKSYVSLVINSNIDFKKFGWVSKVAKIINQKHQKVNQWMKRYMHDFYLENTLNRERQN